MPPWFALVDHKKPTGLGIWRQCLARSRTQLAGSLFGTPPLRIYTMTTWCPTHGGLLRIHSHASACTTHAASQKHLAIALWKEKGSRKRTSEIAFVLFRQCWMRVCPLWVLHESKAKNPGHWPC